MKGKVNPYQKTSISTASKEELVLMLYNGAIKYTRQALDFLKNKNVVESSKNICRAQAIIVELLNSLNFEVGGEIAKNLEYLYSLMVDNLTQANFQKKEAPLELNLQILTKLRDAWVQALENLKTEKAKAVPTEAAETTSRG